jgi:hypothetical protein
MMYPFTLRERLVTHVDVARQFGHRTPVQLMIRRAVSWGRRDSWVSTGGGVYRTRARDLLLVPSPQR